MDTQLRENDLTRGVGWLSRNNEFSSYGQSTCDLESHSRQLHKTGFWFTIACFPSYMKTREHVVRTCSIDRPHLPCDQPYLRGINCICYFSQFSTWPPVWSGREFTDSLIVGTLTLHSVPSLNPTVSFVSLLVT